MAVTYDGYIVTTTNPGNTLLLVTFFVCLFCFVVGALVLPGFPLVRLVEKFFSDQHSVFDEDNLNKNKSKNDGQFYVQEDSNGDMNQLKSRTKGPRSSKRYGGIRSVNSVKKICKVTTDSQSRHDNERKNRRIRGKKKEGEVRRVENRRIGRREEKLDFQDIFASNDSKSNVGSTPANASLISQDLDDNLVRGRPNTVQKDQSSVIPVKDESMQSDGSEVSIIAEMKKMFELIGPWILQSIVTDLADIFHLMLISHYLGLGELICYSTVWFFLTTAQIWTKAWQSSVYKHIIAAVAKETTEGYQQAGAYSLMGVYGSVIFILPVNLAMCWWMPAIMNWFGYDDEIVDMSRSFAITAAISQLISLSSESLYSLLEIEGYARFNAVYDFWECVVGLVVSFFFLLMRPSLFALGVFHLILDIVSTVYFFYLTYEKNDMFDSYIDGPSIKLESSLFASAKSMVIEAVPLGKDLAVEHIVDISFALFASFQGSAEAATWILFGYVWTVAEIAPDCIASAATVRVEYNLSRNNLYTAKQIAYRTMMFCVLISLLCSAFLYDTRRYLAWCMSLDQTLEMMIVEIIPYIALCQPFITAGVTAESLNEVLGRYDLSVNISSIIDLCFTIPTAAIFTYILNYNIEGLASVLCMGYAACGVVNVVIFANTDWRYAVSKTQTYTEV